jgi:hypothetical protein
MSTTALDVDSREHAPPPQEGALDSAQYTAGKRAEQALRQSEAYLAEAHDPCDDDGGAHRVDRA